MIAEVQRTNGTMTLADLSGYNITSRPPLTNKYINHTLYTAGASASGSVLLSTLNVMEQYTDMPSQDLNLHRFTEAMRFGYAARSHLGDPDFVPDSTTRQQYMLLPSTAKTIKSMIDDKSTLPVDAYDPVPMSTTPGDGTSHLVTADASGLATSLTTTINLLFGAQVLDPISGVILNDEMNDFSIPHTSNEFGFPPSPANFIRPHKRPLSSITPVIVENPLGQLEITLGAAGGSRIISSTTQVLWRVLSGGQNLTDAMAEPRLHDQLVPNVTEFEYSFDNRTAESFREKGHEVAWVREGFSAVQGIRLFDGEEGARVWEAVGEPRQENSAGLVSDAAYMQAGL